jgi:predicted phage terminase large subunit-like protein
MLSPQPSARPRIKLRPPPQVSIVAPRPNAVYLPPDEALVEGALLSRNLHDYIRTAWSVINPGRQFVDGWHIGAITEHLEAVSRGQIRKLLINIPFRCTKSLTVGVFWPSWEWTFAPQTQWLCLSYAADLSTRDSLRCRTVIDSRWYQDRWGDVFQLLGDQNVKNRYENTKHGVRISTSLGGLATGEGGDRVVIDDPHNMKEIHSEVARKEVIRVWKESLCSRLNNPATGAFVGVMQRGHEKDFSGYVLAEEEGWDHLCLPMEYEPKRPVYVKREDGSTGVDQVETQLLPTSLGFTDPRTVPGELLSPARFTPAVVEQLKPTLGFYAWSGQSQQRPTPAEGGLFQRKAWRFYLKAQLPQVFDEVVQSWDMAFKKTDDSSRVAGHVWGRIGAERYLLYRVCKRMDFVESLKAVVTVTNLFPIALRKLVEDKANGPAVISMLRSKVPGLYPVEPEGSKEARAQTASVYQQAGNLLLPDPSECPWTNELVEILAGVPRGEWDDCDAMAQAMIYFGPVMAPIRLDDHSVLIEGGVMNDEDAPWSMQMAVR